MTLARRVCIGLILLCAGCLGRGYEDVMAVHVEVIEAMAGKLAAMAEGRRPPPAATMGEFIYPARRARQFVGQFAGHGSRPSFRRFGELLDRYEEAIRLADAARLDAGSWAAAAPAIRDATAALRARCGEIRTLLAEERRDS